MRAPGGSHFASANIMLRLSPERLPCPLVEPSQQVCPHWALVVLHQVAREVLYMGIEAGHKCTAGELCGGASVKVTPIESPTRSLTATKRVCFVRHGQGAHNQTIKNWGMVDPELTAEGESQVCSPAPQLGCAAKRAPARRARAVRATLGAGLAHSP